MPYRRYARKRKAPVRRRRYPVRRNRRNPRGSRPTRAVISRGPVPDRIFLKLNYCQTFTIASTTTSNDQVFRSSLYDPDYTGTGHQPLGRDQWATFYQKYRVYGMKYHLQVEHTSGDPIVICVHWDSNPNTTYTSMTEAIEKSYSKWKYLSSGNGGSKSGVSMGGYMSVSKIFGASRGKVKSEDDFQALIGGNPTKAMALHIIQQAADLVTSVTIRYYIRITFYCEMFDRISLTQS